MREYLSDENQPPEGDDPTESESGEPWDGSADEDFRRVERRINRAWRRRRLSQKNQRDQSRGSR